MQHTDKEGTSRLQKDACHSERSGVSAANGTQSRIADSAGAKAGGANPAKQRLAWIAGFLDSATPRTLQQSAGLRFARNDTRFFKLSLYFTILNLIALHHGPHHHP